ncbi:MAG: hypothetical protein BGO30_07265 [Bacteroidetes bacterium 41-46]|nr:MAG: hypothetical protein BGO30_07265 [Bacteroidetes bacterium 41-46]
MFKHLLIAFLISLLSLSCSKRVAPPELTRSDSLVTTNTVEKLRDTVIVLAPDSSLIRALLECDSTNRVRINTILSYQPGDNIAPPRLSIKNNVLTATANVAERRLHLYFRERYYELIKNQNKVYTKTVVVNELYWYQKTLMYIGAAALFIFVLLIAKKLL